MKEIVKKSLVPEMPENIWIQYAYVNEGFDVKKEKKLNGFSEEILNNILEKVRNGIYQSVTLAPNEEDWEEYFQFESANGDGLIFFQICNEKTQTAWACFNADYLDSDEESPIDTSDGSVVFMENTMRDRELAAKCVEWYAHTGEPYPGMDWMKLTW